MNVVSHSKDIYKSLNHFLISIFVQKGPRHSKYKKTSLNNLLTQEICTNVVLFVVAFITVTLIYFYCPKYSLSKKFKNYFYIGSLIAYIITWIVTILNISHFSLYKENVFYTAFLVFKENWIDVIVILLAIYISFYFFLLFLKTDSAPLVPSIFCVIGSIILSIGLTSSAKYVLNGLIENKSHKNVYSSIFCAFLFISVFSIFLINYFLKNKTTLVIQLKKHYIEILVFLFIMTIIEYIQMLTVKPIIDSLSLMNDGYFTTNMSKKAVKSLSFSFILIWSVSIINRFNNCTIVNVIKSKRGGYESVGSCWQEALIRSAKLVPKICFHTLVPEIVKATLFYVFFLESTLKNIRLGSSSNDLLFYIKGLKAFLAVVSLFLFFKEQREFTKKLKKKTIIDFNSTLLGNYDDLHQKWWDTVKVWVVVIFSNVFKYIFVFYIASPYVIINCFLGGFESFLYLYVGSLAFGWYIGIKTIRLLCNLMVTLVLIDEE